MKVKDIIGNHEISLYVGYNRYGGGYVAMPVYGLDLDCVDLAFACGDDQKWEREPTVSLLCQTQTYRT